MKVHVLKRGLTLNDWKVSHRDEYYDAVRRRILVTYCGYLEVDNPFDIDLWHLCNWDCWAPVDDEWNAIAPEECKNLLIGHCNSDVAFVINNVCYDHKMNKFSSLDDCYYSLTNGAKNEHFNALWPISEGYIEEYDENNIKIVTLENFKEIVK